VASQLHIYDFDNTLFRSPDKPDWWSRGWWGRLESLTPPCVPEKPGSEWWDHAVVSRARKSISDPDVKAVLVTGRINSVFKQRVHNLLRQEGLRFHTVALNPGTSTDQAKLATFENELTPDITHVEIWEDRAHHLSKFESFFRGKGLSVKGHLITTNPMPVACSEQEHLSHTVISRYRSGI